MTDTPDPSTPSDPSTPVEPVTRDEQRLGELLRSLTNITPSPSQIIRIEALRDEAKTFAHALVGLCSDSRERSLAITNLEQSLMWAVKSIILED